MTTNQEARQIAIRGSTSTTYPLVGDWHALWDDAGIASGPWSARMLAWINDQLGTSYTNLPGAMHAYAADGGAARWSDVTTLGEAGFDPATLTGIIGVYDVSDLSSMTVGRDGSGGAPSVGDPVGTLADQATSGNDLAAPSDAARPVLRQTGGGLYYLEHDGVDDTLQSGAITTVGIPIYVSFAISKAAEDVLRMPSIQQDLSNYVGGANISNLERAYGFMRTTQNGINVKLNTHLTGTFPIDTPTVVDMDLTASDLTSRINGGDERTVALGAAFSGFSNARISTTENSIGMDFFGAVFRAGTANSGTDAGDIRTWLSDLSGATLA